MREREAESLPPIAQRINHHRRLKNVKMLFSFASPPCVSLNVLGSSGPCQTTCAASRLLWYLKGSFINLLKQSFGKWDACFGMPLGFSRCFWRHLCVSFNLVNGCSIYLPDRPEDSWRRDFLPYFGFIWKDVRKHRQRLRMM